MNENMSSVKQQSVKSQGSPDKQKEEIYYRNELTWLWRLRSTTVCLLQAREPGKPGV